MHWKLIIGILVTGFVFSAPAQETQREEREITLEECIQLALENNLDIRIQRYNPQIANFSLQDAYGVYDPSFDFSYTHSKSTQAPGIDEQNRPIPGSGSTTDSYSTSLGGTLPYTGLSYTLFGSATDSDVSRDLTSFTSVQGNLGIAMQQPLLKNFGFDRQQIKVRKKDLQMNEQQFILQVMTTIAAVERAYYDLVASLENIKVQQKAVELGERTLAENRKRVEVGAMAPLDEREAEAQVATSRADLLDARRLVDASENRLKSLVTDDYRSWHDVLLNPEYQLVALPADLDVHESWGKGLKLRPELVQARLQLEQQDIILKWDKNQLLPELNITGSYAVSGSSTGFNGFLDEIDSKENPRHSVGAVLSFPLSRRQERYRYRTSKAQKEQLLWQMKKLEQNIMVEIDNAVKLARTNFERVNATRAARQFAEAALDAEQKKLESGKSTTFVVLRLQRDLTDRRAAEIRALADYYRSLTDLALAEGTTLSKNNIDVEIEYE